MLALLAMLADIDFAYAKPKDALASPHAHTQVMFTFRISLILCTRSVQFGRQSYPMFGFYWVLVVPRWLGLVQFSLPA
jgi:hypothetical protein